MDIWTVAEAKAKFSEVIDRARNDGPQTITRNGKTAAVIVSAEEWNKHKTKPSMSMLEFLQSSPLIGADIVIERMRGLPREIDL